MNTNKSAISACRNYHQILVVTNTGTTTQKSTLHLVQKSGVGQGSALIEQDLHDTYCTHSGEKRHGHGTDHSTGHWLFQALNI
jgi:hypothetical protein